MEFALKSGLTVLSAFLLTESSDFKYRLGIVLQILKFFLAFQQSTVNLNNMLCPAVSDPFYGPAYRVCAMTHQGILIPTLGKFYTWLSKKIGLRKNPMDNPDEKYLFKDKLPGAALLNVINSGVHNGQNGVISHSEKANGHTKSS